MTRNRKAAAESDGTRPFQLTGAHEASSCIAGIIRICTLPAQCVGFIGLYRHVIAAGFCFHLARPDGAGIVLRSRSFGPRGLNTAFECLAYAASPNFHPVVRAARMCAGAVLITTSRQQWIGAIIFWPHGEDLLGLKLYRPHEILSCRANTSPPDSSLSIFLGRPMLKTPRFPPWDTKRQPNYDRRGG